MTFMCNIADSGAQTLIIGEDFQIKEVQIGDYTGDFYEEASAEEPNGVVWLDEKAGVAFAVLGFLDEETIVQIAESVVRIEE